MILAFILDNQLDNAKTANSILPEFQVGYGYWQNLVPWDASGILEDPGAISGAGEKV